MGHARTFKACFVASTACLSSLPSFAWFLIYVLLPPLHCLECTIRAGSPSLELGRRGLLLMRLVLDAGGLVRRWKHYAGHGWEGYNLA